MLLRGSKQQLRHDAARSTLQPLIEQLQLPWLCPVLHNNIVHNHRPRRTATSISRLTSSLPSTPLPRPPQSSFARPNIIRGRSYAAHATQPDYFSQAGGDFIPFESRSNLQPQTSRPFPWPSQSSFSSLSHLDPPSSPLIIPDSLRPGSRKFRSSHGVGGSLDDIHLVLRACLQLGQLERAAVMVRRLSEIYRADSSELLEAHNAYLGGIVDKLGVSEDQTLLDHMNRWFEVEMRSKGVSPDGMTFAMMVRATFYCVNEKWVERATRRLMDTAKQYGIYLEAREAALSQLTNEEAMRFAEYEPRDSLSPSATDLCTSRSETSIESALLDDTITISTENTIQPQQQKGHGLTALQASLKSLPSAFDGKIVPKADLIDPVKLQMQLEDDSMESAIQRWRTDHEEMVKNLGIHAGLHKRSMGAIMWSWYENLLAAIKQELTTNDSSEMMETPDSSDDKYLLYMPFLQSMPPEKLAATTIITTLQSIVKKSAANLVQPMTRVVMDIGKAVEAEVYAEEIKKTHKGGHDIKNLSKMVKSQQLSLRAKRKEEQYTQTLTATETPEWSANIQLRVGVKLVTLLIKTAEIEAKAQDGSTEKAPAFNQSMEYSQGRKTGLLGLHSAITKILQEEPVSSTIVKHLPMLTPPLPWTGHRRGGYLKQPVQAVRHTHPTIQSTEYVKLATKKGDMKQVYAALDILGQTPWTINKAVYQVMVDVWNSGEAIADIPPRDPVPNYPPNPGHNASLAEKREYSRQIRKIDDEIMGFHSNRCYNNFQLEVAKAFLGKRMYFPHNMDFRGRAYPIPPYLNHMGADNCRGLLQFDVGKELGEKGLVWLKIHLANLYGFDKASLKEREEFAMKHLEEIHDSAKNPLNGQRWWLRAEDPWQCLATCMELSSALSMPDPTKFISYLPVHQDGTCNGLQHYAALGGDPIGAKQVNLEPGDRPSDIYTAVAEMAGASIASDAAEGDELAKILDGKITRKVVKQTVMTKVYGVTFAGARMQVLKRLDELYPGLFPDNLQRVRAAGYIAKKIFGTLSIMFTGAQDIQLWLGECASRICDSLSEAQVDWLESDGASVKNKKEFKLNPTNKASTLDENLRFKSSVIWTTPLKMPVVQPYRDFHAKQVRTNLQALSLYEPSAADPVHKRKQLQAFPPNFIHSLDATHMFLTALKCKEKSLTFAAVHDSFWTHASDIDTMNTVIRDSFVRMHSDNIVERLAAEFEARYQGSFYRASINTNSALGKRIQALRKTLPKSKTRKAIKKNVRIDEILLEKRRLQLLRSSDPTEQAAGQAMMTPGRLFEEAEVEEIPNTQGELVATFGANETTEILKGAKEAIEEVDQVMLEDDPLDNLALAPSQAEAALTRAKKPVQREAQVYVWRPLTFPPMPKRGTFDVIRLKDSKYFFS